MIPTNINQAIIYTIKRIVKSMSHSSEIRLTYRQSNKFCYRYPKQNRKSCQQKHNTLTTWMRESGQQERKRAINFLTHYSTEC